MSDITDFWNRNKNNLLPALGVAAAAVVVWTLMKGKNVEQKAPAQPVFVACKTTRGDIDIVVRPEWSPLGAARFLQMVDDGFFSHVPLFRCVDNFLCQFGAVPPRPGVKNYPPIADDPKRPDLMPFQPGFLSFAGNGVNSRATNMFITLGENISSLGQMPWEAPFGYVAPESMLKTVVLFNKSYGDIPPWGGGPDPSRITAADGDEYLQKNFPQLDYIESCSRR